jgi:hypothetical protein
MVTPSTASAQAGRSPPLAVARYMGEEYPRQGHLASREAI